jgi:hypothetical protein
MLIRYNCYLCHVVLVFYLIFVSATQLSEISDMAKSLQANQMRLNLRLPIAAWTCIMF